MPRTHQDALRTRNTYAERIGKVTCDACKRLVPVDMMRTIYHARGSPERRRVRRVGDFCVACYRRFEHEETLTFPWRR